MWVKRRNEACEVLGGEYSRQSECKGPEAALQLVSLRKRKKTRGLGQGMWDS